MNTTNTLLNYTLATLKVQRVQRKKKDKERNNLYSETRRVYIYIYIYSLGSSMSFGLLMHLINFL